MVTGVIGWIAAIAITVLNFLVSVVWKPYLKAYAEEAARALAKSEGFQKALRELEITTKRTEEIKSTIEGALWLSQWQIGQKRDCYVQLIETIENWQLVRSESRRRQVEMIAEEERAIDEFRRARSIARLLLDPRVVEGIGRLIRDIRSFDSLRSDQIHFDRSKSRIEAARDHVVAMGKSELKLQLAQSTETAEAT